uniref:Uncharacterized protein n=1 Tax=viral metagenome TaxID=1070528 RepID=A0A6C0IA67_9ZZZZ
MTPAKSATIIIVSIIIVAVISIYKTPIQKFLGEKFTNYSPADAELNIRNPYNLLVNAGATVKEKQVASGPTSEACYAADYSRTIEVEPSFAQRTNNYKRKMCESCSAPNHDFVGTFYN